MQFELPRRHRKSFEVSTKRKLNTKFNKTESLEIFETIKKEYNSSPVTFGSSSGKKEALLELLIITASQISAEYKDCDVVPVSYTHPSPRDKRQSRMPSSA